MKNELLGNVRFILTLVIWLPAIAILSPVLAAIYFSSWAFLENQARTIKKLHGI